MLGTTRVSRTALTTRSLTLLLGATLALSACGATQQVGAAAIVDGKVIRDQDVQTVSTQLNAISPEGEKLSPNNAVLTLILAPYVLAEAARVAKTVPDTDPRKKTVSADDARKVIAKVAKPSPSTITFVQMQLALQGLDQASKAAIVKKLGDAKITVNPRYGTFDAKTVAIIPAAPNWIKPKATSPAK